MRELIVTLRFTSPCLGNVRRQLKHGDASRCYYLLPRGVHGSVEFMPSWWQASLQTAAKLLCRHQRDVEQIRFSREIIGEPGAVPEKLFRRYFGTDRFTKHEAYWPGSVIQVKCLVPPVISDEDFRTLLEYAGKYDGISPAHPRKFGFYDVESVRAVMSRPPDHELQNSSVAEEDER